MGERFLFTWSMMRNLQTVILAKLCICGRDFLISDTHAQCQPKTPPPANKVIACISFSRASTLGSLRKDDGNGYLNVTLKKVKSRCFNIYRAYSISFNSSNVAWLTFFGVEF